MATDFYIPQTYGSGPTSLGPLTRIQGQRLTGQPFGGILSQYEDMSGPVDASASQTASLSQAAQLTRARLAAQMQQMNALGQSLPPTLQPGQVAAFNPNGAASAVNQLALPAGNAAEPLQMAAQARNPALWDTMLNDAAGISGGARAATAAPGVASAAEQLAGAAGPEAAAAGGLRGVLGGLSSSGGLLEGASLPWAGAAEGAGLLGGAKMALGRGATGLGLAVGGNVLGAVNQAAGGPQELTGALKGAGTGAGVGSLFGVPGAVIGGTVGGAVGALTGPAQDLAAVEHYDHFATQFQGLINQKGIAGTPEGNQFVKAARAIHSGKDYSGSIDGNDFSIAGSQMQSKLSKALALQQLVAGMHAYHANGNSFAAPDTTASGSSTSSDQGINSPAGIALQMGQAMGAASQDFRNQGNAQAAALNNYAATQPASIQPLIQADAASRAAYANQMSDAFRASAQVSPVVNQMNSQISYYQQLLSQIRAAQTSANASGSGSLSSALAATVKK